MKSEQKIWKKGQGWSNVAGPSLGDTAQLIFIFGATEALKEQKIFEEIKGMYPKSLLFGCSTYGEICGTQVLDNTIVVTAVHFEHTTVHGAQIDLTNSVTSFEAGQKLARSIPTNELVHAFVLSDGLNVNGSDLVRGLSEQLPGNVTITGGLAGDADRFNETFSFFADTPRSNCVALVGFYGDRLKIGYGSMGGWDPFGPERIVTKSDQNVLYELDDQSALELYKKYLGEYAAGLPATGLLFPLSIRTKTGESGIVRTILSVNEKVHTTKEMGRGTGLGLASVYGIIKNHAGAINVYSEIGFGTTFNIYLPTSGKEPMEEKRPQESIKRGTEQILLIDDQDQVLKVGQKILERLGYTVLPAGSGEEALALYKENKDKIRLVILDMIMPGMNGSEVFEQLKKINPAVKVLLSSGYSLNGEAKRMIERGVRAFIQKPFTMAGISQKVWEILDHELNELTD